MCKGGVLVLLVSPGRTPPKAGVVRDPPVELAPEFEATLAAAAAPVARLIDPEGSARGER